MPFDPTLNFAGLFTANPAYAQMVDRAAGKVTATVTTTTTTTVSVTADAGGVAAGGQNAVEYYAGRALEKALGNFGGTTQYGLGRAPDGALGSFTTGLVEGLATGLQTGFAPSSPSPTDCFPPSSTGKPPAMLSVGSDGTITTAGGYKIELCSQFEWKVHGPDGSMTRVWGDPHVETNGKTGGEKFDFKKDTTFVLPDGTKLNVHCVPWSGNKDFTVTQSIEIIQGNDKVMVTDIDKGKGKTGQVTTGQGAALSTIATGQTFVAGKNVADWFLNGSEIKANVDGKADLFKTGDNKLMEVWGDWLSGWTKGSGEIGEAAWTVGEMNANPTSQELAAILQKHGQLANQPKVDNALSQVLALLPKLLQVLSSLVNLGSFNPYNPQPQPKPTEKPKPQPYDPNQHARGLRDAFNAIGGMMVALGQMLQLMATFKPQQQIPLAAR